MRSMFSHSVVLFAAVVLCFLTSTISGTHVEPLAPTEPLALQAAKFAISKAFEKHTVEKFEIMRASKQEVEGTKVALTMEIHLRVKPCELRQFAVWLRGDLESLLIENTYINAPCIHPDKRRHVMMWVESESGGMGDAVPEPKEAARHLR